MSQDGAQDGQAFVHRQGAIIKMALGVGIAVARGDHNYLVREGTTLYLGTPIQVLATEGVKVYGCFLFAFCFAYEQAGYSSSWVGVVCCLVRVGRLRVLWYCLGRVAQLVFFTSLDFSRLHTRSFICFILFLFHFPIHSFRSGVS